MSDKYWKPKNDWSYFGVFSNCKKMSPKTVHVNRDDYGLLGWVYFLYHKWKQLLWFLIIILAVWVLFEWGSDLWTKVSYVFSSILERDESFAVKFQTIFSGTLIIFAWVGIILIFLTLVGFFLTIWNQQIQIQDSREAFQKQLFENNFFRMLDAYETLVNGIVHIDEEKRDHHGQYCLDKLYSEFRNQWKDFSTDNERLAKGDLDHSVSEASVIFYDGHKNLSRLLSVVYFIAKMIDEAPQLSQEDREMYFSFLLAKLSSNQLAHIFYFAVPSTRIKFKSLIERYALLRDFDANILFSTDHGALYADSAYQRERPDIWW